MEEEKSILAWPSFCGNRSEYDLFWSNAITLNTSNPELTTCFRKTVMIWVPSAWLWLGCLFYLPYLSRRPTKHAFSKPSCLNLWKTALGSAMTIVALAMLIEAIVRGADSEFYPRPVPADYVGLAILTATLLLATITTNMAYRKGEHTSGVLFIYWLILAIFGLFTGYSLSFQKDREGGVTDKFMFVTFYIYYGLVIVMLISNIPTDHLAARNDPEISWSGDDERKPLLGPRQIDQAPGNPCPGDTASFLSHTFFAWFTGMIIKGYRKPLVFKDIWDIRHDEASETIVNNFENHWDKELENRRNRRKPSLVRALGRAYGGYYSIAGIFLLMYNLLNLVNPQVMSALITFVQSDSPFVWQGYLLAVVMFCLSVLACLFMHHSFYIAMQTGQHLRSAIITAVYRKSMRLSNAARKTTTVGEITNLMSVDAEKMQNAPQFFHFLWITPITIGITMVFLWQKLGPSCLVGLAYLLIVIPVNSFVLGRLIAKYQVLQMKYKDLRIKLMNQILTGIKVLKLYAWEPYFRKKINKIRNEELSVLRNGALVSTANYAISFSSQFIVALLCFLTYTLSSAENVLTPDKAFVSISLFNVLSAPLILVPVAIMNFIQGGVALDRIERFLLADEIDTDAVTCDYNVEGAVHVDSATFSWGEEGRVTLKDITMTIESGSLVAVVGKVGSGKSSLIQCVLGEMEKLTGSINVKGSLAYVPQQAWIQNLTVRDNILFDKTFVRHKYNKVLEACALETDLKILTGGDMTEIGERGINLSGGQKQRISVARAVYQNSDIYLLDDPLSAVDSHVGKHIFNKVIGPHGLLGHKTRIFVTNAITFLPKVDKIIVLKDGEVSEMGTYDGLLEKNGAFAEFIQQYLAEMEDEEVDSETEELKQDLVRRISMYARPSATGDIGDSGSGTEGKTRLRKRKSSGLRRMSSIYKEEEEDKDQKHQALIVEEQAEEGAIKLSLIRTYIRSASFFWAGMAFLGLFVNIGGNVGNNIWLSFWSNDATQMVNGTIPDNLDVRLGVYGALGVAQIMGTVLLAVSVAYGAIEASRKLHSSLLNNNLRSPMSFFDTTPLGRILNRFSKDVDTVDADLRVYIQNWMFTVSPVIATLVVIIYSTPIFVAVIIPLAILFIILQVLVSEVVNMAEAEIFTREEVLLAEQHQ